MNLLNKTKLENILTKNWIQFIDYSLLKQQLTIRGNYFLKGNNFLVRKMSISRFEFEIGFIIWVDYEMIKDGQIYNLTSEFNLYDNELFHNQTILNDTYSLDGTTGVVDIPVFE